MGYYLQFIFLLSAVFPSFYQQASLQVEIVNLRNDQGQIIANLYQSPKGFPNRAENRVEYAVVDINNGRAVIEFAGLPPGEYALAFVHDENTNHKMDKNILGMPLEGYGVSNNATPALAKPKYEEAKFMFTGERMSLELTPRYFF